MKIEWLHKQNNSAIIVFCNGWGMDSAPFQNLVSHRYDVLNLYNFVDFKEKEEVCRLVSNYEKRFVIGWSMGVWAGQKLFADRTISFSRTIAINGTLCPVDKRYGISRELFTATLDGWSELSRLKFYHRMCGTRAIAECFLQNQPVRTIGDQKEELLYYLNSADCLDRSVSLFKEAVIAGKDRIVPTKNQIAYWPSEIVTRVRGGHFLFFTWKSWDELLSSVGMGAGGEMDAG